MSGFSGAFETHLTVAPPSGGDHERLRLLAERHGGTFVRIVLDRGETPDQPMVNLRRRGTLPERFDALVDQVLGGSTEV